LIPSYEAPPEFLPRPTETLLCDLVKALVDEPDTVRVEVVKSEGGDAMFVVHVAVHDRGKVIGKQGVTITSLRTLFSRMVTVAGARVFIELADSKQGAQ
jgi:predicted RNA-binding protein YlqC (UPF0109 family)